MGLPILNALACIGKPVSIYALVDPRDLKAFYVGATTKLLCNRLSSHTNDARQQMPGTRCDRIRSILEDGLRAHISVLEVVEAAEWQEAEQFWIAYLRAIGASLANKAIGGAGATGTKQTAQTRARRRAAASGRDMTALHTPEVRDRAARSMRQPIEVNGRRFDGIKRAATALGMPYSTLHHWLKTGRATRL
ncbi:hypothetical protein EN742_03000 [Mesorhizobium sp. M4A.F.Ca.ET.020.02.1.1]|uniref:hypothetical protein n=1 Tax=Mesorhizobium sp. M4A.F.Ca.ET.020.02.1.1 TaxID=2496652 RepID=UPI000FD33378|nr:hypothetical protein [Mesorhizobium sp. M4A.F.Ca.ET.020.02.1.1]RVD44213.1 hypothetical protein EN742_03000 [Mesorhizobium sp. M4A.F.Ca.ET.020.02.1.1]